MSKKFAYLSAAAIGAAALLATAALPASAANTVTTFALVGGTIDIVVQGTATLTDGLAGDTSVAGNLGGVTVTDGRASITGWVTSAASTAFVNPDGTSSTAIAYNSGTVTPTGTVTVTSAGTVALTTTPAPVVTGTLVSGNNQASWAPNLTVTLPANSLAGTYTGTVTSSVA